MAKKLQKKGKKNQKTPINYISNRHKDKIRYICNCKSIYIILHQTWT